MQQTRGRVSQESKCTPTQIDGWRGWNERERERSHGQQGCALLPGGAGGAVWQQRKGACSRTHSDGSRLRKGLSHQCCGRRCCCVLLLEQDTADDAPPTPERLGRRRPRRARPPGICPVCPRCDQLFALRDPPTDFHLWQAIAATSWKQVSVAAPFRRPRMA